LLDTCHRPPHIDPSRARQQFAQPRREGDELLGVLHTASEFLGGINA
jgi:hypothetical protein